MMKTVKAAWDKAPAGPKKDAALKHYEAAEAALKAHNEEGCKSALKQAQAALLQAQASWASRRPPGAARSLAMAARPDRDNVAASADKITMEHGYGQGSDRGCCEAGQGHR